MLEGVCSVCNSTCVSGGGGEKGISGRDWYSMRCVSVCVICTEMGGGSFQYINTFSFLYFGWSKYDSLIGS